MGSREIECTHTLPLPRDYREIVFKRSSAQVTHNKIVLEKDNTVVKQGIASNRKSVTLHTEQHNAINKTQEK